MFGGSDKAGFSWFSDDAGSLRRLKTHLGKGSSSVEAAGSHSRAVRYRISEECFGLHHIVEVRSERISQLHECASVCARTDPSPHMMAARCFSEEKIPEQITLPRLTQDSRVLCNSKK